MNCNPMDPMDVVRRADEAGQDLDLHLQAAEVQGDGRVQVRYGIGEQAFSDDILRPAAAEEARTLEALDASLDAAVEWTEEEREAMRKLAEGDQGG